MAAYFAYFLAIGLVVETFVSSSIVAGVLTAIACAITCTAIYLVLHRPHLIIGDSGIVIVNPLSRHEISWGEVEDIETKYTMSVTVKGKRIHAWAAPASGRYHARKLDPSEIRGMVIEGYTSIAHSDSPRSDSGVAAHIARLKWSEFKKH